MDKQLSISEKLFLLNINPQKGGMLFRSSQTLDVTLCGAIIMELYLLKVIGIANKRVSIGSENPSNDLHKFVLEKFVKHQNPKRISFWISKLGFSVRGIKKMVKAELVQKRLIRLEERRFLFFKWYKPYLLDKMHVREIGDKINKQLFEGKYTTEEFMVLSLLMPNRLLFRLFPDREKRKNARKKLKGLPLNNKELLATQEIVKAIKSVIAARAAAAGAAT